MRGCIILDKINRGMKRLNLKVGRHHSLLLRTKNTFHKKYKLKTHLLVKIDNHVIVVILIFDLWTILVSW